jgi:hypothetical protein
VHAVIGRVNIELGRENEAQEFLTANVVPMVKQSPGLVGGYWLAPQDGKGLGITIYETEDAARKAVEMAQQGPRPEYVTWDSIEVREVIAQTSRM